MSKKSKFRKKTKTSKKKIKISRKKNQNFEKIKNFEKKSHFWKFLEELEEQTLHDFIEENKVEEKVVVKENRKENLFYNEDLQNNNLQYVYKTETERKGEIEKGKAKATKEERKRRLRLQDTQIMEMSDFGKSTFSPNFSLWPKNSIFDKKICFWRNSANFRIFFWAKFWSFAKLSIYGKTFDVWEKFRFVTKISIFYKNFDFW